MSLVVASVLFAGCSIKTTEKVRKEDIRPQLEASEAQLVAAYNAQARAVHSLQATVNLVPSTGSSYSGVIEQYHDVPGFILAQRPAMVRVIGQAPVVATNIFDMVSDGDTFRIFIPSKNTFLVGSTSLVSESKKPIENLRPQHIVESLFWPELAEGTDRLVEQFDADPVRYYILSLLRKTSAGKLELAGRVWFDRVDLGISRLQLYGPAGRLDSDITYADWQPIALTPADSGAASSLKFPRDIRIWRPQDDYKLDIRITKLTVNQPIAAEQFNLAQPAGTQLVRVGEEPAGVQR